MGEGFSGQVILCWPSDRRSIEQLNALIGDDQRFHPTVEHSLSTCDGCGQSIWIADQQLQLSASVFVQARKLCMFCAGQAQRILSLNAREYDLNPAIRTARRRTT